MTTQSNAVHAAGHALPPIVPDLFEELEGRPGHHALVGGHCAHCDRHFFPLQHQCSACFRPLQRRVFGERGHIYSFTVVRTKAPFSLPEPYAVGYVDLADVRLRVFALLDPTAIDQLTVGAPVILKTLPLGVDGAGTPCVRPVFCLSHATGMKEAA